LVGDRLGCILGLFGWENFVMSKRKRKDHEDQATRSSRDAEDYSQASDTFSKLDQATLSYYKEIRSHLEGLTDDDQRSLLAANALGETKGKI
jgi:hypothetical protein